MSNALCAPTTMRCQAHQRALLGLSLFDLVNRCSVLRVSYIDGSVMSRTLPLTSPADVNDTQPQTDCQIVVIFIISIEEACIRSNNIKLNKVPFFLFSNEQHQQ